MVPFMDKKEINSPRLTAHFVIWMIVACLLLFAFLGHFVWKAF
jgi:F0F1-type ATP synthase membrane subunit b/b'